MKCLQVHGEDRHEEDENEANPTTGFGAMEEKQGIVVEDKEIWLERGQEDLLDVSDVSIFYGDFPALPDFPCMSSSSSSSSTPAPVKAITSSSSSASSASSSSSAASWAVLKSEAEEDVEKNQEQDNHHHHHNTDDDYNSLHDPMDLSTMALYFTCSMEVPQPPDRAIGGAECMDVMEDFGYMDLLESNDFFDIPSSIFHPDESLLGEFQIQQKQPQEQQPQYDQQAGNEEMTQNKNDQETNQQGGRSDDLALVFLDWLKSNKETVSADDLRKVKLKKATVECAAKRLGGGKEGMKQLLKLILQWVQTNHLQKRRMRESPSTVNLPHPYNQDPLQNQNPNPNPNPNLNCNFLPADINGASNINGHPYATPQDYNHMLESTQSWPPSKFALASHFNSFPDNNLQSAQPQNPSLTGYGNQYPYQYVPGHGDNRLARLGSSATKEARKKRMARQRRFLSHHRNHNHYNIQHQNQSAGDPHARLGQNGAPTSQANPGNWVSWPAAAGGVSASTTTGLPVDRPAMQTQNYQRQAAADKRQGWKPEKNLRFLLQKVLKQSDVGSPGRIVLPKKEAETHLPELEVRDGISIAMEDIGTSRVWNMRYRFWPNNKSRMYLLENTGDFVRTNGLQEGDFIVIYSDVKCGKYLIRGVKVRQPAGFKSENKRAGPCKLSSCC